jgi:hypothetical protein
MFQMIEERKTAVSNLPNQIDTSVTEEKSDIGEWFGTSNLLSDTPLCLQFIQLVDSNHAPC